MASFFDGLYKILKDKFKFSADVLKNVKEIQIGCDNSTHITNQILYIDPKSLDDNTKLQEIVSSALKPENKEAYLVLDESKERFVELKEANNTFSDIEFFKDKIQSTDFAILQIAIYCDYLYLSGNRNKGDQIKQEAFLRYGELARNIINLYTSKYFESTIRPLYEILNDNGDPNFKEKFAEMYRIIVMEEIFTLFVNSGQTVEQILQKLREKIEINKSYGAYKINIHGINSDNVDKIETVVKIIKDEIDGSPFVIKTGEAIIVKLFLKKHEDESFISKRNNLIDII